MPPQTEPQQSKKPELSNQTIALMAGVALFFDGVQALFSYIFLGWLIIPFYYLTFWIWFRIHGVSFFNRDQWAYQLVGAGLEFVTAGIAPAFFILTLTVALSHKVKKIAGI